MDALEVAAAWTELQTHIRKWYSEPDLEALEIALCVYISHLFVNEDAIYLFVIGPPGTGKTGIVVSCLSALPSVHVLSDLTATTFLSGFAKGNPKFSYLHRIAPQANPQAVLVFKDFTSFLGRREETRKELASQLREIHDGYFSRPCGSSAKTLEWRGKLTVIAACTPALERAWSVMRELGDRFLAVRWLRGDGIAMGLQAAAQIGREKDIRSEMHRLVSAVVNPTGMTAVGLPDATLFNQAAYLSELVARLRTNVIRDSNAYHDILIVPEPEGTSRLMKGVCQLARARATLFRKPQVTAEDFRVVQRALLDAIPLTRLKIFENLPDGAPLRRVDLQDLTRLPTGTLDRELEDLQALSIVREAGEHTWAFTDAFAEIKAHSF